MMRLALQRRAVWILSVIGLVSQIALGAVVLPDRPADPRAAIAAVAVLCGQKPAPGNSHQHRAPAQVACSLSVALALPAAVPLQPVLLAPPAVHAIGALPAIRAPPVRFAAEIYFPPARGPPAFS